jgi:hypothetical protein
MENTFDAFWSYTHEDDERLNGAISSLARRLGNEYAVSSGDNLNLFLDRQSLNWGDTWREKIDSALGTAPLLIAIITPKFVRSVECRRELLTFASQAESRGFSRLLLPILFIDTPGLDESSADEVMAIVARTQYVSWSRLRLLEEDSSEVRTAVNALARRIMHLQAEAQQSMQDVEKHVETQESATFEEVFSAIRDRLPTWAEAVDADGLRLAQWNSTVRQRTERAQRVANTRGRNGALLSVFTKLGLELAPMAKQRLEDAQTFHRLTIELDPFVASALRLVSRNPAFSDLLDELRDGIAEAMPAVVASIEYRQSGKEMAEMGYDGIGGLVGYSPHLRQATADMREGARFVGEANEIVAAWDARLGELDNELAARQRLVPGEAP